jgi:hypothetical protein
MALQIKDKKVAKVQAIGKALYICTSFSGPFV